MAQLNFNAANVVPDTGIADPVPAGWYVVMATDSDIKPTSNGAGARLAMTFTIQEPAQYAGRKLFTGFNIKNDNPVAQDIAFKQLSALAHAVGILQVEDSQQLHGQPLKVRVKVKPASGQYEAGNDITAYRNMAEQVKLGAADPAAASASVATNAPAAGGGMQQPAGFGGGMQMQQPAMQMQQPVMQQQPVTQMQQQPQQMVQQPVQQMQQQPMQQAQQPMQQAQQPTDQAWQPPQAQQPWAGQGGEQVQQPQMQQQAPVQQMQQQPVMQQQMQQPVMQQQQPVVQQQQMQQPAVDPSQVAAGATPPWMTNGQQPAQ